MSDRPTYAVRPEVPSAPSQTGAGAARTSMRTSVPAAATEYRCQPPAIDITASPSRSDGSREATTSPTAWPKTTSPRAIGSRNDGVSLMRSRAAGARPSQS